MGAEAIARDRPTAVLFVCLGNICRSPQAEGIFRHLLDRRCLGDAFVVDSAGTSDYHAGSPPDWRTAKASEARGVPLTHRSRPFTVGDFDRFDHILVMDRSNLRDVLEQARSKADSAKVSLLRAWDPAAEGLAVPDPYAGGERGFDEVFDMCQAACEGLLARVMEDKSRG